MTDDLMHDICIFCSRPISKSPAGMWWFHDIGYRYCIPPTDPPTVAEPEGTYQE